MILQDPRPRALPSLPRLLNCCKKGDFEAEVSHFFASAGNADPVLGHLEGLGCNALTPPSGEAHNHSSLPVALPVKGKVTSRTHWRRHRALRWLLFERSLELGVSNKKYNHPFKIHKKCDYHYKILLIMFHLFLNVRGIFQFSYQNFFRISHHFSRRKNHSKNNK